MIKTNSIKLRNKSDEIINPATDDTLQNLNSNVATETTLQNIDNKVATEVTLTDVKTNTANIGTPLQDTKIPSPVPQEATGEPQVSISRDNVGLAKDASLQDIITRMAKDSLRVESRTTTTDEFIASGEEAAFSSYTVDLGFRTMVRGRLEVFDILTAKGLIKVEGFIRVGGI